LNAIDISVMSEANWTDVAVIYQEGIDTGDATFAPTPPASWQDWCAGKFNQCSIVARREGKILGWAALSPVSSRQIYAGVAEVSVYVSQKARQRGVGSRLLQDLIEKSEANGIWTLQAGIFPENQASLSLHFKHGFRVVGRREKLGKMDFGPHQGEWRDVLLLERRSKVVGTKG
jgi:L-amino acid N-acyltransferase YncA